MSERQDGGGGARARSRPPGADERSPLLPSSRSRRRFHASGAPTPRTSSLSRHQSLSGSLRHHSRQLSFGARLSQSLVDGQDSSLTESKRLMFPDDRVWYDQFTSTDWVHDIIADSHRVKALRSRRDFWGRLYCAFDAAQGWILSALCGFLIAVMAYCVNVAETTWYDWKDGYCAGGWWLSERYCDDWRDWGSVLGFHPFGPEWTEFAVYLVLVVGFALASCLMALATKTVVPSAYRLTTLDEDLAAPLPASGGLGLGLGPDLGSGSGGGGGMIGDDDISCSDSSKCPSPRPGSGLKLGPEQQQVSSVRLPVPPPLPLPPPPPPPRHLPIRPPPPPPMVYYPAAGSGVAEVRVILSGFVLHGFLGLRTLVVKSIALVLSVASGLSIGKEGPYVHIAACVGNVACRLFPKYDRNDGKRREVLSAAASAGVAVAFGAPLGGVLFGLEEVSYFFPAKTLFRTFFCCIVAALTLKFLNPYGTGKIVMFQVRYVSDWEFFELAGFIAVGLLGGAAGALFIKASKHWATSFRRIGAVRRHPTVEVALVATVTGLMSYWNPFTKLPVASLMYSLASPCLEPSTGNDVDLDGGLAICPRGIDEIPAVIGSLLTALLIKGFLTVITFGIKVPAGIYVPSMVVGGLMGRTIGHAVQWVVLRFPGWAVWASCAAASPTSCIQPGVYGLVAAGSTMCGVTRLSVTLAVILFELTGSLDHVLPFSLAILVAKWTADWIEPNSIYDLLTNMNSYPFLDNKRKPVFTSQLADIVPRPRRERVIDISSSPLVSASALRIKLDLLHRSGELDGGLPIVRDGFLVGLLPAPDLAFGLDQLEDEDSAMCLMAQVASIEDDDDGGRDPDPCDFTRYIDPAPVALDVKSPMDIVYECFVKLGLRYICVLKNGRYAGMTHKKRFVRYMRQLEEEEEAAR